MRPYRVLALFLACSVLVTLHCGCATMPAVNVLSTEDEIKLGEQLSAEVEKSEKVLEDPAIQAYVREIGARLARISPRQNVPYTFTVIDNPEVVNAFALPGGHMYVYTGLMKLCQNEAELASVMAHEIGHVAAEHHGEALGRQWTYEALVGVALGANPRMGAQLAAEFVTAGFMARYSRANEREADALGLEILFRAGYRPEAMPMFMYRMLQEEGRSGPQMAFRLFPSHPDTEQRVIKLDEQLQQYPPDLRQQNPLYEDRYRQHVLSRLK